MVNKPIFVVGCGRSGSTAFFERFSKHHQLCWPTGFVNKLEGKVPCAEYINKAAMAMIDVPIVGEKIQNKFWLGGGEVYPIWNRYYPGFSDYPRDLFESDVTNEARVGLHRYFSRMLTSKRNRAMTKITGWPRLGYLNAIFPDAKFINVVRDGRAVANSFLHVDFWRGKNGPGNWQWGPLSDEQNTRWDATHRSQIGLAALNWEILVDAMEKARPLVPSERFLEVRYEEMCENPDEVFAAVNEFCELDHSPRMKRFMDAVPLRNSNQRYKSLPAKEIESLEFILSESLPRHGY